MADTTFASVSSALEQRFRKKVQAQPNRATVLLNLLAKEAGSGKNCAWDITVGTGTGQVFDDGADVVTFNTDTDLPCIENWSEMGDAFAITGLAEDTAADDSTDMAQLYMKRLVEATQRAAAKINVDLWTADGSASPQKLHGLLATAGPLDSTGTYAGQSRASFPQWASNKLSNGGVPRAPTIDLIEQGFEAAYLASGRVPQACITTTAIWLTTILKPPGPR